MRTYFPIPNTEGRRDTDPGSPQFGRESEPADQCPACGDIVPSDEYVSVPLNNDRKLDPDTTVKYGVPLITGGRQSEGHTGVSGLARHSVGELYPWDATVSGDEYSQFVQPRNLLTGECCPFKFRASAPGRDPEYDLLWALESGERWIRAHKGLPNPTTNQPTGADVL